MENSFCFEFEKKKQDWWQRHKWHRLPLTHIHITLGYCTNCVYRVDPDFSFSAISLFNLFLNCSSAFHSLYIYCSCSSLTATVFRSGAHTGIITAWSGCSEVRIKCFKQTLVRVVMEDILDWILSWTCQSSQERSLWATGSDERHHGIIWVLSENKKGDFKLKVKS